MAREAQPQPDVRGSTEPPVRRSEPSTPPSEPAPGREPPVTPQERPTPRDAGPGPEPQPRPEPRPSGTCQSLAPMSGEKNWSLKHDGVTRSYSVFIPPQYKPNQQTPVILNFHGLNSNPTQQKLLTGMNAEAGKRGFIAVHPQGRSNSWNGGLCCSPASSLLKSKDVGFVSAMLDDIQKKLCIDPKRIYATGISNGAYMAYRLACELSDRIAAIAPVAGLQLISPCKPKRPLSVIAFHGTADLIVPFEGRKIIGWPSVQDSVDFWVKNNGCNANPKQIYSKGDTTCKQYSGCKGSTLVTLCVVKDGGHTWPGGFPIPGLGKTTNDINATSELIKFFLKHKLP